MVHFKEPDSDDPSVMRPGESEFEFLSRSTWIRARNIRAFMNDLLSYFPEDHQKKLYTRLEDQWKPTYFEMIVGRTLQLLGADLEYESGASNGKRPDYLATFPDGKVYIEATAPYYDVALTDEQKMD